VTSKPYPCKGSGQQSCSETVTYTPKIVIGFEIKSRKATQPPDTETAYLTCRLDHTNPYTIDKYGEIIG
jgi:hypothetical protein